MRVTSWIQRLLLVAFSVSIAISGAQAENARLVVAGTGAAPYVIALAEHAKENRVKEAARLLRAAILEATGAELPVVKESEVPAGTPAIYLGRSSAARRAGVPVDTVRGFACLNRTVGKDIFLVGEDGSGEGEHGRIANYRGELKAVALFLENQAGVRFLQPGEYGKHIPKLGALTVDAAMDEAASPPFEYVTGRSSREPAYDAANNFFGNQIVRSYGGHSYYAAVPEKTFGETHPEYFALIGGVRTPKGNHLCVSNPDVQELMLQEMERELGKGHQWVELAQTDGYRECPCAECRAIHPDPGERLWIVHRKLAEEMKRRRPDKKVMIICYGPTTEAPRTFDRFPGNVVVQLCRYGEHDFRRWARFDVPKTVYIYNWMAPARIAPRYAVDQIRRFAANGVRGIYICGGLSTWGAWGLDGPAYYAFGHAIGDPERNAEDLAREYIDAAFGEAAAPMRAFFGTLHRRTEAYALIDQHRDYSFSPDAGDRLCHFLSPKVLGDMGASLERALSIATDERVRARLAQVDAEFGLLRDTAAVYHMYRAYRLAPGWETLEILESAVRTYRERVDWLMPEGKVRRIKGLRPPFSDRPPLAAGAPFSWDFDLLREKRVLPGVGMKRAVARPAGTVQLDGGLDEAFWRDAPFHDLSEIGMGRLENRARFKVAYDGQALYVGFEAEIPAADSLDGLRPAGRDGAAWLQENIEIMIDPLGTRQRYCHFMLNPVPNSRFDRRFGYEDDPLHPLYGDFDLGWDGEWHYAAAIDRERRQWTAEVRVPFTDLGVEPAQPGEMWCVNVGRTQRPADRKQPILSLWSPNLESRSFHDMTTFGELTFR